MRKVFKILTFIAVIGFFTYTTSNMTAVASEQQKKTTAKKKSTGTAKKATSGAAVDLGGREYFGFLNMPGAPGQFFVVLDFDSKTEFSTLLGGAGGKISDTYKATKTGSKINVLCNVPTPLKPNFGNTFFNLTSTDNGASFKGKMLPGSSTIKVHDIWFLEVPADPKPTTMSTEELTKIVTNKEGYMLAILIPSGSEVYVVTFDTYFNEDGSYTSTSEFDVPNLINQFPFVGNYEISDSKLILTQPSTDNKIEVELCDDGKFAKFEYKMPADKKKSDFYLIK